MLPKFCHLNCTKFVFLRLFYSGPRLKVVGTNSVGLDHVDREACRKRNVQVGYTPDVLTEAVAEMTIGLLLATARRFKEGMGFVHKETCF